MIIILRLRRDRGRKKAASISFFILSIIEQAVIGEESVKI